MVHEHVARRRRSRHAPRCPRRRRPTARRAPRSWCLRRPVAPAVQSDAPHRPYTSSRRASNRCRSMQHPCVMGIETQRQTPRKRRPIASPSTPRSTAMRTRRDVGTRRRIRAAVGAAAARKPTATPPTPLRSTSRPPPHSGAQVGPESTKGTLFSLALNQLLRAIRSHKMSLSARPISYLRLTGRRWAATSCLGRCASRRSVSVHLEAFWGRSTVKLNRRTPTSS